MLLSFSSASVSSLSSLSPDSYELLANGSYAYGYTFQKAFLLSFNSESSLSDEWDELKSLVEDREFIAHRNLLQNTFHRWRHVRTAPTFNRNRKTACGLGYRTELMPVLLRCLTQKKIVKIIWALIDRATILFKKNNIRYFPWHLPFKFPVAAFPQHVARSRQWFYSFATVSRYS